MASSSSQSLQGSQAVALWQAWGVLEQRQGRPEQARILYQQGLEATPYNRFLLLAFGQLEKEAGNIPLARSLLKFGVKNNPLDPALTQVSYCRFLLQISSDLGQGKIRVKVQTLATSSKMIHRGYS